MAYTTINKSSDYFKAKTYTGNGSNGHAITGVGFQPDMLMMKSRTVAENGNLYDSVRGAGERLIYNSDGNQSTKTDCQKSFDSDGFTVDLGAEVNENTQSFISWCWKAGTSSGINQDGASITPTAYSFNQTAGISIIKYTGTGSGATLPHGLGVTPNLIIVKVLTGGSDNWTWKSDGGISGYSGFTRYMYPNNAAVGVANDSSNEFQYSPTATKFSLGTNGGVNGSGRQYVAYCFANKTGYQKIGGYVGTGNTNGSFIYTGFAPKFFVIHRLDSGDSWVMKDDGRSTFNPNTNNLYWDNASTEGGGQDADFVSNGIKYRSSDSAINDTGGVYVYWAIGQSLVGSNNVPCTAR